MRKVLSKAIVAQYYKINTGFFLVTALLLFGLLNGKDTVRVHHFVMQQITTDYRFLLGAFAVWTLYNIKCVLYNIKELRNPANSFIYTMQSMPLHRAFWQWLGCHFFMMLPVLLYGGITVAIGIKQGDFLFSIAFLLFQLLLCAGTSLMYCNVINSTWKKLAPVMPRLLQGIRKKPHTFLLHYSLNMRKGTFIALKALSMLLLQGMVTANEKEINKESVAVLMMFLIAAHSLLPVYYVQFAETRLGFLRNMPIKYHNLFLTCIFTYAVIFLPELVYLLVNSHHALPLEVIVELYMVAITQMLLYTSMQYISKMQTDRYTLLVMGLFFGSLLFLASFNLVLLASIEVVLAIILFSVFYKSYENSNTSA